MRTLAFDGRMGAAGDMILGALLAAGADRDALAPVERALDVEYVVSTVDRSGISATGVEVLLTDPTTDGGDDDHDSDGVGHGHDDHTHAEGHGPHRSYPEVVDIVAGMDLPDGVEADALAIFEILGDAEAAVHGTDIDETQLAERADWALRGGPLDTELVTPTGAAILAHVADGVDRLPSLTVDGSGYGAGAREFDDHPNVLRATVGESEGRLRRDDIAVLETNLDDAPPEVLGDLQRSLSAAGARDVSIVPLTMKKSRPGHLVKVICKPDDAEQVARRLAEETGTLGVREHGAGHRWVAERAFETVTLDVGGERHEVHVKVASDTDGEVYDVSCEFDDAAAVGASTGVPTREIIRRAEQAVRE